MALMAPQLMSAQRKAVAAPMEDRNQVVDNTLDSLNKARFARPLAGSSRKGDNPVLFLVGNSTMRTGTLGNGNNGQWGWGRFFPDYFDSEKITVENHALGGTSSRTFYERLWEDVLSGVRKGDWVMIELGHNDNGPYDSGRARASIPGIGKDTLHVTIKETGEQRIVYTYGEYLRRFIRETKAKGANPILLSLTPRNAWADADSTVIERVNETFGLWARQVAKEMKVPFIDLNEISAAKFERFGKEKVKTMFYIDRIHTSEFGARTNAASAAEGLRGLKKCRLTSFLKPVAADTVTGKSRTSGRPVVFTIGDSTVKNEDSDENSMWGWGSVLQDYIDPAVASVENHAVAGRSARMFVDEGHWDKIYNALQPGDIVLIQFGHNDAGPINSGKERAELPGTGAESKVFKMKSNGQYKVVYTYGWYLRKFIMDAKEKGAVPVVISHTPRNKFDNGLIENNSASFGAWTAEVAGQLNVPFIDLNGLIGRKLQHMADHEGLLTVNRCYKNDHSHFSLEGARLNAREVAETVNRLLEAK
ncbi:rhamnogalacturonan acetylesterase [Duncaniella muris]|uniref:rhamnogalacturonan acetylesterase n=3 Tax=Duncaniella muris TaxID=2094150 RepID=UPI0025B7A21B|nr:rhamnogalacturonan acetylesterase [Duncaniella muris]